VRLGSIFEEFYQDSFFVRLVKGSSRYQLGEDDELLRPRFCDARSPGGIFSAIDNLVKGAAGQAVQNMNLNVWFWTRKRD